MIKWLQFLWIDQCRTKNFTLFLRVLKFSTEKKTKQLNFVKIDIITVNNCKNQDKFYENTQTLIHVDRHFRNGTKRELHEYEDLPKYLNVI